MKKIKLTKLNKSKLQWILIEVIVIDEFWPFFIFIFKRKGFHTLFRQLTPSLQSQSPLLPCDHRVGCVPTTASTVATTMRLPNNHHYASLRSTPSSSSSSSSSSHSFISKILLLLTLLPVSLAAIAFVLQWRGGVTDPTSLASPGGSHHYFPGMEPSALSHLSHSQSHSDCVNLGRTNSPSFPYYHNWKLDFGASLTPKVPYLLQFFTSPFIRFSSLIWIRGCYYFLNFFVSGESGLK